MDSNATNGEIAAETSVDHGGSVHAKESDQNVEITGEINDLLPASHDVAPGGSLTVPKSHPPGVGLSKASRLKGITTYYQTMVMPLQGGSSAVPR